MKLTELQQVNALIGLSKPIEGWPSTLLDLGYELERMELSLSLASVRPGITEKVTPDLFFLAESRNYSFLVELKSGTFQDLSQPDKLVRVTPKDLIQYGRVAAQSVSRTHKISVAVIINEEHLSQFQSEFQRKNHAASLISIGDSFIKTQHGTLADTKAARIFQDGIDISSARIPTKLIPVLPTADNKYELAKSVINSFKYFWLNNEYSVTPQSIALQVFGRIWGAIDSDAQKQYLNSTKTILREMSGTEFHTYMRHVPEKTDEYKLLKLPETSKRGQPTRDKQTFQKALESYRQRKLNNKEYTERVLSQENWLDMLDEPIQEDE